MDVKYVINLLYMLTSQLAAPSKDMQVISVLERLLDLEPRTHFLGHHSPTHASAEDCPWGVHLNLMAIIPRKGTRLDLARLGA